MAGKEVSNVGSDSNSESKGHHPRNQVIADSRINQKSNDDLQQRQAKAFLKDQANEARPANVPLWWHYQQVVTREPCPISSRLSDV
jgi:hypothetical protein